MFWGLVGEVRIWRNQQLPLEKFDILKYSFLGGMVESIILIFVKDVEAPDKKYIHIYISITKFRFGEISIIMQSAGKEWEVVSKGR